MIYKRFTEKNVNLRYKKELRLQALTIYSVDNFMYDDSLTADGAVAQLGEHNAGSVGVRGSNPLSSTKYNRIKKAIIYGELPENGGYLVYLADNRSLTSKVIMTIHIVTKHFA